MKTANVIIKDDRAFKNLARLFSGEFKTSLDTLDWDKEIVQVICHRADDAEKRFTQETGVMCFSELRKMRKNGVVVIARVFDRFGNTLAIIK